LIWLPIFEPAAAAAIGNRRAFLGAGFGAKRRLNIAPDGALFAFLPLKTALERGFL
jgi:hypothetical protein